MDHLSLLHYIMKVVVAVNRIGLFLDNLSSFSAPASL